MLDKVRDWFGMAQTVGHPGHGHDDSAEGGHGHTHGAIDPTIVTTERGIWAIKWSFVILAITAALQIVVVLASGSIALLADTIHNVADATTAIPLWMPLSLPSESRRRRSLTALGESKNSPAFQSSS